MYFATFSIKMCQEVALAIKMCQEVALAIK
jgi:hypothetical protein